MRILLLLLLLFIIITIIQQQVLFLIIIGMLASEWLNGSGLFGAEHNLVQSNSNMQY